MRKLLVLLLLGLLASVHAKTERKKTIRKGKKFNKLRGESRPPPVSARKHLEAETSTLPQWARIIRRQLDLIRRRLRWKRGEEPGMNGITA